MPVSLHAITGMGRESQWKWSERYMRATVLSHEVERSFSVLIFSGVLDRFPDLQIVSAENNCGWIPYYLQRMDRAFDRGRFAAGFNLKLKPSEYFQRQMHATYIDDFVGVANRHFIGVDRLMWSSDYPHQASSWPHSQDVVARDFKDASAGRAVQDHPRQRRQALRIRALGPGLADALLEVRDLRTYIYTRRGIVKAVDGATLLGSRGARRSGSSGESGSGKSMTCLSILRLVPGAGRAHRGRRDRLRRRGPARPRAPRRCGSSAGRGSR